MAAKSKKAATNKAKTTRKPSVKKGAAAGKKSAPKSQKETSSDRRAGADRRKTPDRRKKSVPVAEERRKIERRAKVNRRRQIDPTTCERDYTPDELEFMSALDEYKRTSGRMFPTCSEILEVLRNLGYEKRPRNEPAQPGIPATETQTPPAQGKGP